MHVSDFTKRILAFSIATTGRFCPWVLFGWLFLFDSIEVYKMCKSASCITVWGKKKTASIYWYVDVEKQQEAGPPSVQLHTRVWKFLAILLDTNTAALFQAWPDVSCLDEVLLVTKPSASLSLGWHFATQWELMRDVLPPERCRNVHFSLAHFWHRLNVKAIYPPLHMWRFSKARR